MSPHGVEKVPNGSWIAKWSKWSKWIACGSQNSQNLLAFHGFVRGSDVVARGIDIPEVTAAVNYSAPSHIQTYIHRVGRTARAGKATSAESAESAEFLFWSTDVQLEAHVGRWV